MNKQRSTQENEKQKPWGCKRERERELQFSKIKENHKANIACICDEYKDRVYLK